MRDVIIPGLKPAFISAGAICFATAMGAFGPSFTAANGFDQRVGSGVSARMSKRSPGPARIDSGMIIGSADDCLEPGSFSFLRNVVFRGKLVDRRGSQRRHEPRGQIVEGLGPRSILYLECVAKQNCLLDMLEG